MSELGHFDLKPESPILPARAREHLDSYWRLSRRFFKEGNFALASFFAITLIEEVGKVIILGNETLSGTLDKKGFYRHESKYMYAVGMTLIVNSRVTHIYGNLESRFAKWFREGELFRIRNRALYMEPGNNAIETPRMAILKEDAFLLVCIAGEIYAEIQGHYTGTGPDEWQRVLLEVDSFRNAMSAS